MNSSLDPNDINTVADVVRQLTSHRSIHMKWAEHFEQHRSDKRSEFLGDAAFHRRVEARYTKMIEVLGTVPGDKQ